MRGGGKLGKPTHLRRNLRRMMGRSATFFFARYEGVPRGHLNQHYERTDQVFSALPSRPTGDVSVDFLDMSAKDRAGTTRRSLTCMDLSSRLQHSATPPCAHHGCLAGSRTRHPSSNTFQYFRM